MFELQIQEVGHLVRLIFTGEFDHGQVAEADKALRSLEAKRPRVVVIDLSQLTFIDSAGVRFILQADMRARRHGRRFALMQGPETVHRVFHISGIDRRLEFADKVFPPPRYEAVANDS